MDKAVLVEIEGSVAIITLNRPERYNAVNQDLLDGFNESFSIVENDDSVRAVILTGKGKGFCAGADMSTFGLITPEQSRDYIIEKYKPLIVEKKSVFRRKYIDDNTFSYSDETVDKIINYKSEKIADLNVENIKIIKNHPPDIIFIYSKRSAESFVEIAKKYALNGLMTESRVLCISEKVLSVLKSTGWKKLEIFVPGEEIIKLEV